MTESIDRTGAEDTPQRPRGGHWRRLWRTGSTTQAPGDTRRAVGALGANR